MSKKNLPNIPIYIGDWERDCNVLSLESEAAWMRIVFKLWTKGKQNTIKIPAKSLQNLWRCSVENVREILNDLRFNNICEINEDGGFIEFTCRRFVKENELSEIRSKAAKGEKEAAKFKQTKSKNKAKTKQNADNDYENDIVVKDVIEEKGGVGEKEVPTWEEFKQYAIEKRPEVSPPDLRLKFEAWQENGWRTSGKNGHKIKNWKTTLLNTLPHIRELPKQETTKQMDQDVYAKFEK